MVAVHGVGCLGMDARAVAALIDASLHQPKTTDDEAWFADATQSAKPPPKPKPLRLERPGNAPLDDWAPARHVLSAALHAAAQAGRIDAVRALLAARADVSSRMRRRLERALRAAMEASDMGKGDEVSVALDMGSTPPTFPRVRFVEAAGGGEAHIRLEAELVWRGASLELTAQIGTDLTGYVAVPLALSELVVRGTLRFQAAPCGDAPYLGQCSVSFLSPPQIDFVLRPLRAFDVMEVPLLQRRPLLRRPRRAPA